MMLRRALGPRPSFVIEALATQVADRMTLSKCSLTTADVAVRAHEQSVQCSLVWLARALTTRATAAWGVRRQLCAVLFGGAHCS